MATDRARSKEQTRIEARGLTRRFGSFVAVDDIDITVCAGEVFGLLGANGAGKTTAIRMLCGTLPPSEGEIRVAGMDMVREARRARGRIGYVSQRFALYADLTVAENLRLQAGLYGLDHAQLKERLEWALRELSLGEMQKRMAGGLPLGYQRRLALAAALLHEPDVLFLDEPTSGVDPIARQQFWELIYDLADNGIAILVTTHYMDEALFCDRLALMDRGRIIAEDTPGDLVDRPLPTPMLVLNCEVSPSLMQRLQARDDVMEIIPHAGQVRLRLQPDADVEKVMEALRELGEAERATPELEDVFVALLEEHQAEREQEDGA
jgi:ABC-2 type transport system ATP-binding protein